jgi:thiamine biosynthesis protein ThiI
MYVTEKAIDAMIFRPLVAFDKTEIMELAKKIGTYEISILPHDDSCSLFTPKNPETKANLNYTESEERKIDLEKLILKVLEKIEILE